MSMREGKKFCWTEVKDGIIKFDRFVYIMLSTFLSLTGFRPRLSISKCPPRTQSPDRWPVGGLMNTV